MPLRLGLHAGQVGCSAFGLSLTDGSRTDWLRATRPARLPLEIDSDNDRVSVGAGGDILTCVRFPKHGQGRARTVPGQLLGGGSPRVVAPDCGGCRISVQVVREQVYTSRLLHSAACEAVAVLPLVERHNGVAAPCTVHRYTAG